MPVNLNQYPGTVGTFNSRYLIRFRNSFQHVKCHLNDIDIAFSVISFSCSILTTISIFFLSLSLGIFACHTIKTFLFSRFIKIKGVFVSIFVFTFFVSFLSRKLLLSGNIETNPGPRRNLSNHFTICHWNLNSISAHNFAKVQLLKAYLAVHKFDIVCLSETYLNSSFPFDDDILKIIAKLDPNKAHGHDKTSIRMIKICSTSICKTIEAHFQPLHRQWYISMRVEKS